MSNAYQQLTQFWNRTDSEVIIAHPDEGALAAFEAGWGLKLPSDFRDYLRFACPADVNFPLQEPYTEWWPLSRIKTISKEYEHPVQNVAVVGREHQYLVFADGYLWCWAWAIACTEDEHHGRVVLLNGAGDPFVAPSFTAFVDAWITDPNSVERAPVRTGRGGR
jgi:hypothetical protein